MSGVGKVYFVTKPPTLRSISSSQMASFKRFIGCSKATPLILAKLVFVCAIPYMLFHSNLGQTDKEPKFQEVLTNVENVGATKIERNVSHLRVGERLETASVDRETKNEKVEEQEKTIWSKTKDREVDIVIKHPSFEYGGAKSFEYLGQTSQLLMIQYLSQTLGMVKTSNRPDFVYVWNSPSTLKVRERLIVNKI